MPDTGRSKARLIEDLRRARRVISRRKRADEALREANEYLENLFNYANAPIIVWNPQFRITRFNHAFESLTGRKAADVIGESLEILFPPALVASSMGLIRKTLSGERWETVEIDILHVDGAVRTVLWNSATLFAADGTTPVATIAQGYDITDRKRAEQELDRLFDVAVDMICIVGFDGCFKRLNPAWEKTLGHSLDEMLFKPFIEFVHTEDHEATDAETARLAQGARTLRFENRYRCKDGSYRWLSWAVIPAMEERLLYGVARDVTEQKRTEEMLRETNEYLENLFNYANAPIIVWDPQFRITRFNRAFESLTGRKAADVIGKSLEILFPPALVASSMELIRKTLSGERWETVEINILHLDGAVRTVLWNSATLFAADGKTPVATIAQGQDITERKEGEEALRASEERFRATFEQAAVGIAQVAPDGHWMRVNRRLGEIVGYTQEELLSFAFRDITHPDDLDADVAQHRRMLDGAIDSYAMEKRYIRKDRSVVWVNLTVGAVRDDRGTIKYFVSVVEDITERKRVEEALRDTNEYLGNLFNYANAPIIVWDPQFRITRFNHAFESLTGRKATDVIGASLEILFPPALVASSMDLIRKTLAGERWETVEINILHVDGSVRTVLWNSATLFAADGTTPVATIAQGNDITERKQAEQQLARSVADLERSNKELEQFAYVASHDLQEPLRMISSYTQLLAQRYEGQLDEKATKYIHYAVDGAIRMQGLISDLLTYSRVGTRGKPAEPTDAHAVLEEAIRNLATTIEESRAVVTNDDLPTVRTDASQLMQVFQNLVANAIRFRRDDLPRVHVSARDDGSEWVFSVRDNGIGIDPQYAERVFVIFQRLHTRQEYPGTGIGLALCKRIVERHGGRIWFQSEPGKGSTFFFSVPK